MSDDLNSHATAAQMMAVVGQLFNLETRSGSDDSNDAWVGYESAFPFPVDQMTASIASGSN